MDSNNKLNIFYQNVTLQLIYISLWNCLSLSQNVHDF